MEGKGREERKFSSTLFRVARESWSVARIRRCSRCGTQGPPILCGGILTLRSIDRFEHSLGSAPPPPRRLIETSLAGCTGRKSRSLCPPRRAAPSRAEPPSRGEPETRRECGLGCALALGTRNDSRVLFGLVQSEAAQRLLLDRSNLPNEWQKGVVYAA